VWGRVIQFRVPSKVWVCELSRILTNPKSVVREPLKVRQTYALLSIILGPKIVDKNAGKSFGWPSDVLFLCALTKYTIIHVFETI
jgi:hypothetical protein